MKAVLAGFSGQKKLYYILDAASRENDGAVVMPDGRVVSISFFGFATSARKLKRLQKTPFHKFLWSEPDGEMKQIWIETFITKKRPLPKKFMNDIVVNSKLGNESKKQKNIENRVKSFLQDSIERIEIMTNFSTLDNKSVSGEKHGDL